MGQKQKCNECDFKTCVPKYLKGHKVKHSGQFMCQRGCKMKFTLFKDLDEHIKTAHSHQQPQNVYQCGKCDEKFNETHKLRQHITKQHAMPQRYNCEQCDLTFNNSDQLKIHEDSHHSGFKDVNVKLCRYFARGYCWKEKSLCTYSHDQNSLKTPECRNGPYCRYLASGSCSYFHRGVGVQNPRYQSSNTSPQMADEPKTSKRWCRYMEDCHRVPECPFSHYDQDFPQLTKNIPPGNSKTRTNVQMWQEY